MQSDRSHVCYVHAPAPGVPDSPKAGEVPAARNWTYPGRAQGNQLSLSRGDVRSQMDLFGSRESSGRVNAKLRRG